MGEGNITKSYKRGINNFTQKREGIKKREWGKEQVFLHKVWRIEAHLQSQYIVFTNIHITQSEQSRNKVEQTRLHKVIKVKL